MRHSSGDGDWEGIFVVVEVKAEARSERTPLGRRGLYLLSKANTRYNLLLQMWRGEERVKRINLWWST